ncbi:hypothetical protein MPL3365_130525 [Mesorhizobium plurifarium]|uniref:Uncharacterized protein n=1 Tax=Mesorhizobium plurifarium TaxID=69974 RepID=A0A090FX39_MESPL|nr:hypothetical protein MPL3365_130525 [Mesorhizobium plurifarium]
MRENGQNRQCRREPFQFLETYSSGKKYGFVACLLIRRVQAPAVAHKRRSLAMRANAAVMLPSAATGREAATATTFCLLKFEEFDDQLRAGSGHDPRETSQSADFAKPPNGKTCI